MINEKYNVNEIFYSIQGEGTRAGLPCLFIRFQGCNLKCKYCDTIYAQSTDLIPKIMSFKEIIDSVELYNCRFIEFTGGEPLLQNNINLLMSYFCDKNYCVAIETNGTIDIAFLDKRIIKIMDIKCLSSGQDMYNKYSNILYLNNNDEIKFVISDKNDFNWALETIKKYDIIKKDINVLFSPVYNRIDLKDLANWILDTGLPIRLQLQLHKIIWGESIRGV